MSILDVTIPRYPDRLSREELVPLAYRHMYLSRVMELRLLELFKTGAVKGTVTFCTGNEAVAAGMAFPLRPGKDVVSLTHRDFISHISLGNTVHEMLCQYMANAESMTHGREGNVHHGKAAQRRFPMMSHLGGMLATVVGGVWAARLSGEDVIGLSVMGDGGTSTGDFHETLNLASVRGVPVLFLIENNRYAFSTPTRFQYACEKLSDRSAAYGIEGATIDGTDITQVYGAVCDAIDLMRRTSKPYLLECVTFRMHGHAAYDKGDYVPRNLYEAWMREEPVGKTRRMLSAMTDEAGISKLEKQIDAEIETAVGRALKVGRPDPTTHPITVFAPAGRRAADPFTAADARNFSAVTMALDYLLQRHPEAVLLGQDIGPYGSAFKTCKGLYEKYGPQRVVDMPICESAMTGCALGMSQTGGRPIVEFQFADFSTEAVTQLGLNSGTWFFRSGCAAPLLFRLPCGGGITVGAFHSGEFDGLWSRFPGLKILYPVTPQETFEAIVAGFYDPNPCLVMENKFLYTRKKGDIAFDGDLDAVWRSRRYCEGDGCTIVGIGAMTDTALEAAKLADVPSDVWNLFLVCPLDIEPIVESVKKTGRLLVVQETGETAGLGDRIVSLLIRRAFKHLRNQPVIVSSPDCPVPFAPELETVHRPDAGRVADILRRLHAGEDQ